MIVSEIYHLTTDICIKVDYRSCNLTRKRLKLKHHCSELRYILADSVPKMSTTQRDYIHNHHSRSLYDPLTIQLNITTARVDVT